MKNKYLLFSGLCLILAQANATNVNLATSNYSCNGVRINNNLSESMLKLNCKNYSIKYTQDVVGGNDGANPHNLQEEVPVITPMSDDDVNYLAKIRFLTDQGVQMECFYRNSKITKCKLLGSSTSVNNNIESK